MDYLKLQEADLKPYRELGVDLHVFVMADGEQIPLLHCKGWEGWLSWDPAIPTTPGELCYIHINGQELYEIFEEETPIADYLLSETGPVLEKIKRRRFFYPM